MRMILAPYHNVLDLAGALQEVIRYLALPIVANQTFNLKNFHGQAS